MNHEFISNIYLFLILFILFITKIEAIQNFKAFLDTNNIDCYYIITKNAIIYYKNNIFITKASFPASLRLTTEEEFNLISINTFKNTLTPASLLKVKNYVYAVSDGNILCSETLSELPLPPISCEVYCYKCANLKCYYFIGCIHTNKELTITLYESPYDRCETTQYNTITINNINSENFSCQLMESVNYNDKVLVCFYRSINSNQILATGFNIDLSYKNVSEIYTLESSKLSETPIYIKSMISQNASISYVCYINSKYMKEGGDCLTYDINSNKFSPDKSYLKNCLTNIFSLNLDYYKEMNQYFLYCFQSSTKLHFINLNENFSLYNEEILESNLKSINCSEYYFSRILHNIYNITIFMNCDDVLSVYYLGKSKEFISPSTISTTLPIISSIPSSINNAIIPPNSKYLYTDIITNTIIDKSSYIIAQKFLNKTREEIINKVDEIINEIEIGKEYEFFGNDYNVKIGPLNAKNYGNLTTYIDFSLCEDILKKYFNLPSNEIINLIKIEIYNNTNPLFLAFDGNKNLLDLSLCIKETLSSLPITTKPNNNAELIISTNIKIDTSEYIVRKKINKTKEEIKDDIEEIIKDYEIGKIYELYGNDYDIKISPINTKDYNNISTYIEFSICEDILRKYYDISPDETLSTLQIEIYKNNSNSLINQVEYTVFNEKRKQLDLSLCSKERIKIHYNIVNSSALDIDKISNFKDMDVDIFNINDSFFNDICFPYSEKDNDLILKDRVEDIYQNYTLCDNNCTYDSIDIENMTITCNCEVKTNIETDIKDPSVNIVVYNIFRYSTFKVIQCYQLVLNFNNKKNNIGFWLFSISVLFHLPLFCHYIIYSDIAIKTYIKKEFVKYDYLQNSKKEKKNPIKRKNGTSKRLGAKRKIKLNMEKRKKIKFKSSNHGLLNSKSNNSSNIKMIKKESGKYLKLSKYKGHSTKNISINNINILTTINSNRLNITSTNEKKEKKCGMLLYNIINVDTRNHLKKRQINKFDLEYYNFPEAVKNEKKQFCELFYVSFILKEKIINTFLFKSPLEVQVLRICLLIFIYSCNFAFNTLFYFSDKISDKYHYKNDNVLFYILINNISICVISTLLSNLIVSLLNFLINSKNEMLKDIRVEEMKMRNSKKYFIKKLRKKNIYLKLEKIIKTLKLKNILFIFIEFIFLLFFYYFTTAFCEVYKSTQKSWIIDCATSFIMSIFVEILLAFIIAILYHCSIRNKIYCFYRIAKLLL